METASEGMTARRPGASDVNDGVDDPLVGLPLEEAAEVAVERGEARNPEMARNFLSDVAEDGVVSEEGVDAALDHASEVVSKPENRFELAATALEDARNAAGPDADRPIVRLRLDQFDAQLASVEGRVERLRQEFQGLVEGRGDEDSVYDLAKGVRQLEAKANDCQRTVDELALDISGFEQWLADAEVRYQALREDLDDLGRSLDRQAATVDGVVGGDGPVNPDEWLDAGVEHRVLGLALGDLRWELDAFDRWAAAEGVADECAELSGELDGRLDELAEKLAAIGDRLDEATPGEAPDRRLAAVEDDLDALDPPIDWDEVEATLDSHRGG